MVKSEFELQINRVCNISDLPPDWIYHHCNRNVKVSLYNTTTMKRFTITEDDLMVNYIQEVPVTRYPILRHLFYRWK